MRFAEASIIIIIGLGLRILKYETSYVKVKCKNLAYIVLVANCYANIAFKRSLSCLFEGSLSVNVFFIGLSERQFTVYFLQR